MTEPVKVDVHMHLYATPESGEWWKSGYEIFEYGEKDGVRFSDYSGTVGDATLAMEKAGFARWRQKGSHLTLYRASDGRALTVPVHFSKTVPKGTLRAIIKQAGLTPEDFLRFAK